MEINRRTASRLNYLGARDDVFFAQIGYVIDQKEVSDMLSMFSESFWAIAVFVVYALALLAATAYIARRKRSVTVRDGPGTDRDH